MTLRFVRNCFTPIHALFQGFVTLGVEHMIAMAQLEGFGRTWLEEVVKNVEKFKEEERKEKKEERERKRREDEETRERVKKRKEELERIKKEEEGERRLNDLAKRWREQMRVSPV